MAALARGDGLRDARALGKKSRTKSEHVTMPSWDPVVLAARDDTFYTVALHRLDDIVQILTGMHRDQILCHVRTDRVARCSFDTLPGHFTETSRVAGSGREAFPVRGWINRAAHGYPPVPDS